MSKLSNETIKTYFPILDKGVKDLFEFNTINFQIFGIPSYLFFAILGFVVATCVYIILMASKGYDVTQCIKILLPSIVGMAIGAKLFGFLTSIYRSIGNNAPITLDSIFDTGIVFYGGLFGFLIIYFLCLRLRFFNLEHHAINILVVCIPLFHAFARLGCFSSGCCYGMLYDGIGSVKYIVSVENGTNINMRLPIQLLESLFNLGIFLYLFYLQRNEAWRTKNILIKYLAIYSIGRFFLEYGRGDVRRGIIGYISFSQAISILLWGVLIVLFIRKHKSLIGIKEE